MGDQLSTHDRVSKSGRASKCLQRLGTTVVKISRNRSLIYFLTMLVIIGGVARYDHTQRANLAKAERKIDHALCVETNRVKIQANERIRLLKAAENAVVFRSEQDQSSITELTSKVKPIPRVNCEPLRPGN